MGCRGAGLVGKRKECRWKNEFGGEKKTRPSWETGLREKEEELGGRKGGDSNLFSGR